MNIPILYAASCFSLSATLLTTAEYKQFVPYRSNTGKRTSYGEASRFIWNKQFGYSTLTILRLNRIVIIIIINRGNFPIRPQMAGNKISSQHAN